MSSVLQPWVEALPLMQQTTLLTAIRGPDGNPKYAVPKMLLRWYRRCVLISALDGVVLDTPFDERGGSFTGPSNIGIVGVTHWRYAMIKHVTDYIRELDGIPAHFQRHFMHAIQILGYKHPDEAIREFWHGTYQRLVNELHLQPESELDMDARLSDNQQQWLARSDTATHQ